MYISLYTASQLQKLKDTMLWMGLFMLSGGLAALFNDMVMRPTRWDWALAAFLVSVAGVVMAAVGTDKLHLKEAYFSITPARISYRLSLLSNERMIYWKQVSGIQLSDRYVLFDLNSGRQVLIKLGAIQSYNIATRVAISIQEAALERNVAVKGMNLYSHNTSGVA